MEYLYFKRNFTNNSKDQQVPIITSWDICLGILIKFKFFLVIYQFQVIILFLNFYLWLKILILKILFLDGYFLKVWCFIYPIKIRLLYVIIF